MPTSALCRPTLSRAKVIRERPSNWKLWAVVPTTPVARVIATAVFRPSTSKVFAKTEPFSSV